MYLAIQNSPASYPNAFNSIIVKIGNTKDTLSIEIVESIFLLCSAYPLAKLKILYNGSTEIEYWKCCSIALWRKIVQSAGSYSAAFLLCSAYPKFFNGLD